MDNYAQLIQKNNKTHTVDSQELSELLAEASVVYSKNFEESVYFERSIFTNWTCAIADCKYCYLSTKPKHNPQKKVKALRSHASILAEALVCKAMGWKVGYITGGLRVESTEYLIDLAQKLEIVLGEKIMMNFGPYSANIVKKFSPHIRGMGSAIESFDEDLHSYICPSKPLKSLLLFLESLKQEGLQKLITIILGIGERKKDVDIVIDNIKKFGIDEVQLCFLKPQENTVFASVPAPNPEYMAYWIANLRIACPTLRIKVALVRDRISDTSLYLRAGANGFTRFMVFSDFGSNLAHKFVDGCNGRLQGEFITVPKIDIDELVDKLAFDEKLKGEIKVKAKQYMRKLV